MDMVWWKQVTKANIFVHDITAALLAEHSVVLCTSDHLPWPDTMREIIQDGVNTANFDRTIRQIRAEEVGEDPGAYLFNLFCEPDFRAKYRPGKGGYAKFLADCEGCTLSGVYIWVVGAKGKNLKAWNDFLGDYLGFLGKKTGGVFLLEAENEADIAKKKNMHVFAYEKEIGAYDYFVFNLLLATEYGGSTYGKQYLAELVSYVVGADVELSAKCIRQGENFLANPYEIYKELADEEAEDGKNIIAKTPDEIEQAVWTTQIKLVFPLIEEFRRKFIKRRGSFVQSTLPHPDTSGHIIRDPQEVEIGMLNYLASKNQWPLSYPEWEGLKLHHEARNILAHMGTLTVTQMKDIFRAHA